MKYLLDTNTVSYAIRGIPQVVEKVQKLKLSDIVLSSVTEAELRYGVEKRGSARLAKIVNDFVQPLEVLPFDSQCACVYAKIVVDLEKNGFSIDTADAMIAACCIRNKAILVTSNVKHFEKISKLKIENWN